MDFKKKSLVMETSDILDKHKVNYDDVVVMENILKERMVRKSIYDYSYNGNTFFGTAVQNSNNVANESIKDIKKSFEKMVEIIKKHDVKIITAKCLTNRDDEDEFISEIHDILLDHKPPYAPIIIDFEKPSDADGFKIKWDYGMALRKDRDIVSSISVVDNKHYFDCECDVCIPKGDINEK